MKSLFVVDDDASTRLVVKHILTAEGYHIESFENTSKFLHKIKDTHPDLILLDIRLPDGDGVQLCKIVKRNSATSHIPVIMMSSHSDIKEITREALADGFIQKPFEFDDLRYIIKKSF